MHRRDPALEKRRQAECDAATSAADLELLQLRWREEDAAMAEAADWRTRELELLRQRVGALERLLGPNGKTLIDGLAKGFGQALGASRTRERERMMTELDGRGFAVFAGVWDEAAAYAKGSLVSHSGSLWIATGGCEPGARPGRGPCWRLAVKGGDRAPGVTAA